MKRKILSLMIALSMVISLVCVMPVAVASAQSITGKLLYMNNAADEPDPDPTPGPTGSYDAILMYNDPGYNWNTTDKENLTTHAAITGSGTYIVGVDNQIAVWEGATPTGIRVMAVDIAGYAKAIGAAVTGSKSEAEARDIARKAGLNITNVSIIADGKEVYKYNDADVMFGDIEAKGNIRIDIWNEFNESGNSDDTDYNAPQEIKDLAGGMLTATETLKVKFTLTYNKPATPGNKVTPDPKTTKTTVVKPKKVTKLGKVKIKPILNYKAKKVKIKWKKVRGATGYQYKISLNKKYKKAKIKSTKKKSFSFKFKLNKNYKVGVRAYKKVGNKKDYGKWTIKNIDFRTK